jgi:hypothetical protein
MELHDFTKVTHDFADTAALIDTTVAHLAGALGKL